MAEPQDKPTVLTDQICLIPGDAPIVRVEDAPGNARRIFTGVDIRASVDDVWEVMTDYEALQYRVPNLVKNRVLKRFDDGGARLEQVGRASWRILGRNFFFQASTTLDVNLYPDGIPEDMTSGTQMCASSSAEVREYDRNLPLVKDIYPRPFSISVEGVPIRDIAMQNVDGALGDFVHYRGVWRLQPLEACATPGQDMMRLTFAVECQPHWFLPVAPVESRIATAMVENMDAIRDFIEARAKRDNNKLNPAAGVAGVEDGGASASNARSSSSAMALLPRNDVKAEKLPSVLDGDSETYGPRAELLDTIWLAVLEQHPEAVRDRSFLGMPLERSDVEQRWPRLVQTLGVSEDRALEIIETDVTPLLVESDDIAEILSRLAAISSREKALELIGWNPSLLVGGAAGLQRGPMLGISTIVDILYAGRLLRVLDEDGRDDARKLAEIELYSNMVSGFKPFVDAIKQGWKPKVVQRLWSQPLQIASRVVPNEALRIFMRRLAVAPNPIAFLLWQTKAGISMVFLLIRQPALALEMLQYSPAILPHLPSIYTRLSVLEPHVPGIIRILDPYLEVVKPHLDRIMERMDQIEPHLPYILLHLDVLAKHCGALLDHFDELLPFATEGPAPDDLEDVRSCYVSDVAETESLEACILERWNTSTRSEELERRQRERSYLPRLLPYIDFLVPRLDRLSGHLPLIRPHLPLIIPYLDDLLPYIDHFVEHPAASKNADVLTAYLGWVFKVPLIPDVMKLPLVPRFIAGLSTVLPRWPVRGLLRRRRRRFDEENCRPARSAPSPSASSALKAIGVQYAAA